MLSEVRVRNYAVIDEVELELDGGMTVLSGETGAGKSILVDALGLVLGDRADAAAVRHGAERADIAVTFELTELPGVRAWLAEQDLDAGDECVLRRVVSREGRSRAYVNGNPAPLQTLRRLGEQLVEIHGQHEHQTLTRAAVQREILDAHGRLGELRQAVAAAYDEWRAAADRLAELKHRRTQRDERIDLLRYQVRELESLGLEDGELEALELEHARLANTGRLAESGGEALMLIYDDESGSAQQRLARARDGLARLADTDPALAPLAAQLEEAEIQVSDAAAELRSYLGGLEMDPARLDGVENRLGSIRDLARKHQIDGAELPARLTALRAELAELEQAAEALEQLTDERDRAAARYREHATALGEQRAAAAPGLAEGITATMRQLGMPGGRFELRVEHDANGDFSPHGLDRVEFAVTANPGQPAAPLARVASGGELSRIALAVQVVATGGTQIPCLVFDEIDTGVGGGVAEIVGRRLRELGDERQVLCVTHLPQVASQGHHHVRVSKLTDGKTTRTTLAALGEDETVEELARMLGGVEITATSRDHAREMLVRARAGD
jgi:DNA repair protein RecN (Recombination protein N)